MATQPGPATRPPELRLHLKARTPHGLLAYTLTMRRLFPIALLLAVATSPLAAQETPMVVVTPRPPSDARAVKPPAPTGRITGTVLCTDTHRPARGAVLFIQPLPAADGSVDAGVGSPGNGGIGHVGMDGTYTVEHLVRGEYSVNAILPGYISAFDEMISSQFGDTQPPTRQQLARYGTVSIAGAETERYDITLERGAAVSGRVLFSDGSPATQVTLDIEDVNAKKLTGANAREMQMAASMARSWFTHQSQNTDDQGHFRISGLKPGTYRVAAAASMGNTTDSQDHASGMAIILGGSADPSALRVYSGDTLHSKSAKTYKLRSGDEVTGIDITIPLNAYHQVKGVLTAVDGRAINKATLTLADTADDTVTFESQVSEEGAFAFPAIAAGTYTLTAKGAEIVARQDGSNPDISIRNSPTKITNTFADNTTSVIVKDSDVPDLTLTLTEVPLPPQPTPPTPPNPEDQPQP
jgi:hypothetical protein